MTRVLYPSNSERPVQADGIAVKLLSLVEIDGVASRPQETGYTGTQSRNNDTTSWEAGGSMGGSGIAELRLADSVSLWNREGCSVCGYHWELFVKIQLPLMLIL